MRRDLKALTRFSSAKFGRHHTQNVSLHSLSNVNNVYSFIARRRAWNNRKRGLAEARRAALPPWWTLKRGDIARIAKELGKDHSIIVRDYQILRAREFDSVGTMRQLLAAIDAMRPPDK